MTNSSIPSSTVDQFRCNKGMLKCFDQEVLNKDYSGDCSQSEKYCIYLFPKFQICIKDYPTVLNLCLNKKGKKKKKSRLVERLTL